MMSMRQPRWKAGDHVCITDPGWSGDVFNIHAVGGDTAVLYNLARKHPLVYVDMNLLERAPQVSGRFRSVDVATYVRGDETTYVCCNEEVQDVILSVVKREPAPTAEDMVDWLRNRDA